MSILYSKCTRTANLKISEEHSSFRWIEKSEIAELNFEDDKVVEVIQFFLNK